MIIIMLSRFIQSSLILFHWHFHISSSRRRISLDRFDGCPGGGTLPVVGWSCGRLHQLGQTWGRQTRLWRLCRHWPSQQRPLEGYPVWENPRFHHISGTHYTAPLCVWVPARCKRYSDHPTTTTTTDNTTTASHRSSAHNIHTSTHSKTTWPGAHYTGLGYHLATVRYREDSEAINTSTNNCDHSYSCTWYYCPGPGYINTR